MSGRISSPTLALDSSKRRRVATTIAPLLVLFLLLIFTTTRISSTISSLLIYNYNNPSEVEVEVVDYSNSNHAANENDADNDSNNDAVLSSSIISNRNNCQIIYILGVEGANHHGFTPILQKLAAAQQQQQQQQHDDPATTHNNTPNNYEISYLNGHLRRGIFGHHNEKRPLDDPSLVRRTLQRICPTATIDYNNNKHIIETNNGSNIKKNKHITKHITIEDSSFPSGHADDPRTYRIHRMPWWSETEKTTTTSSPLSSSSSSTTTTMMEDIANSHAARNHPTNLKLFYKLYSPHADVKFVVLHRPFEKMVLSHIDFDNGSVEGHSNVIRGFLLVVRRFLDWLDKEEGEYTTGEEEEKLWTLVCVDRLESDDGGANDGNVGNDQDNDARRNIVKYLAKFLGWSNEECPECFSHWKMSTKNHLVGQDGRDILEEHVKTLKGIWPPPVLEGALPEQMMCSL